MLKMAGSICILLASIGLAASLSAELKEHIMLLYEIRQMLVDIAQEAGYSLLPMEQILQGRLHIQTKALWDFCQELGEKLQEKKEADGAVLWQSMFWKYEKKLRLDAAECDVLEHAGRAFFGKNTEENERNFALYLERLDYLIDEKRKEVKEKKRVAQTLSMMGGLMLIVLLA